MTSRKKPEVEADQSSVEGSGVGAITDSGEGKKTFEEAVLRLETIVTSLEDGRLSLEDSLSAYEEGLGLARSCLERLDQAELRVRQLAAIDGESED